MAYYTGGTGSTVQSALQRRTPTTEEIAANMVVPTSNGETLPNRAYPTTTAYGTTSGVAGAKKSNSGGGTGGAGGSATGGAYGGSSAGANAYNALLAAYQQRDYSDYLNQMRAAAQAAYDRGMASLSNAYNSQLGSLQSNLDETRNQLRNGYNNSRSSIMNDAENSLRQAYINHMMSQKNLGQQMSAMGLSGGATETTMANLANNYGNARNNINTTQNKNLTNLESNYNDSLSQAMQAYNNAVANANLQKAQQEISLENALANNQISALQNYQSLMANQDDRYLDLLKAAIANGADFSYVNTAANNPVQAYAMTQAANPMSGTTNYAARQALQNLQSNLNGGMTSTYNDQAISNYLANILKQLG